MTDQIHTRAAELFHLNVGRTIGALEILVSMAESYCNGDELRAAILNAKPIVDYWTKPQLFMDEIETGPELRGPA